MGTANLVPQTPFVAEKEGQGTHKKRRDERRNWRADEAIEATRVLLLEHPNATSRQVMNYLGLGTTRSAKRYIAAARMPATTRDQEQLCPNGESSE